MYGNRRECMAGVAASTPQTTYSVTDLPGGFFDVDHPLTTAPSAWPTLDVLFVPHDRSASGSVSGIVLFTATSERSI